jgi:hypothetical protein
MIVVVEGHIGNGAVCVGLIHDRGLRRRLAGAGSLEKPAESKTGSNFSLLPRSWSFFSASVGK